MATINRFEDIDAWQKALRLTKSVYSITSNGSFSEDFGLRNQMRRSAVSIMSNIAEGFERGGNNEFRQFLAVAKGSAGELRSQLYVALEAGYISEMVFKDLYQLVTDTRRLIAGFMTYLKNTKQRGSKYK